MSFKKGLAVTGFKFGLLARADGTDVTTGTPVGYVTKDDGVQTAIGDVTPTHKGNGQWTVDLTSTEMDGAIIGLTFTHVSAVTVAMTISTVVKLTNDLNDLGGVAQSADNDTKISLIPTTDSVADLTPVLNALATVDTNVDNILVDTNELQTNQGNWTTASDTAVLAAIGNVPTNSEFNARSLPTADYFVTTDYIAPDNTGIASILVDTDTTIPTLINNLNNFNPATTTVDVGAILGTPLTETTAARLADNLSLFFNNGNAVASKVVDDVGTAVSGVGEFTSTEKNQMRYRLGMDGVTAVPVATPDLSQFDGDLSSLATAAKQTTASVDISNILVDTNELQLSQGDWATPVGFSTAAQVTALDTKVTSILEDTGTTLPALLAGLENLTGAEVKALVVEALTVDTTTEPVSIPTSDASIVDKLSYVFSFAGNKILQTGTAQTLRNSTDTLDISTAALTTDGVTTTRGKHS